MMFRKLMFLLSVFMLSFSAYAEDPPPADYVNYIELKPILTNYGSGSRIHFVKAEMTIQVSTPNAHHAVNFHKPQIRHKLVFLLSDQTVESMEAVDAQSVIAQEALRLVQDVLIKEEGEAFVSDLFFTSFITQGTSS
ncbi:MAG: flagellar basal body-associated FliL family protein [Pontibacterium sp.]